MNRQGLRWMKLFVPGAQLSAEELDRILALID
jgi:hypothetical protein